MKKKSQDRRLERRDANTLELPNPYDIPVRILANDKIPIGNKAVDELESLLGLQKTLESIQKHSPDFFANVQDPRILETVLTPDFHKGAGVPIGTVLATGGFAVPQAIGNDVNCGMRLMSTSLMEGDIKSRLDELEKELRYVFFEGGRDIPMLPAQREALLRYGLPGLVETKHHTGDRGLWKYFNVAAEEENLGRMHGRGGYQTDGIFALKDYLEESQGSPYDSLIGNVGGGNHFAEIQYVKKILDGKAAHAWGLKTGQVVVMIHSGSLGLGHVTGQYALDLMKSIYPEGLAHPENNIYPLPASEQFAKEFHTFRMSMRNSANFAFGNRFFLSLMVRRALENTLGETETQVIYDAPHNLMWETDGAPYGLSGDVYIHRKGATPAGGLEATTDGPYEYFGEPVIVPGSMGSSSFLLQGKGKAHSLCSACHGAGRELSRGEAMRMDDSQLDAFLKDFRIITPLDPKRVDVKGRRDIMDRWREDLKQEAPYAYKDITPVIQTLTEGDIANPVAEFFPIMTVKA